MARLDNYAEDIIKVVRLDEERIANRLGEVASSPPPPPPDIYNMGPCPCDDSFRGRREASLQSIQEEDEDDDYPLDD